MWRLGIMCGRLSPPIDDQIQLFPRNSWREEVTRARDMGFECMEWVFDLEGQDANPLCSADGVGEMRDLAHRHRVAIDSVVFDDLMTQPFWGDSPGARETRDRLEFLLRQSHRVGIRIAELPLMKEASIREEGGRRAFLQSLRGILPLAEELEMTFSLETDLAPQDFRSLLKEINHPSVGINYDSGNSTMFGFDPDVELPAIGAFIVNVHIKDGLNGGGTVPLGSGETDFERVFRLLADVGYQGDVVLQPAREDLASSDPKRAIRETMRDYVRFVRQKIAEGA